MTKETQGTAIGTPGKEQQTISLLRHENTQLLEKLRLLEESNTALKARNDVLEEDLSTLRRAICENR